MFLGRVGNRTVVEKGLPSLLKEMALGEINTPRRIAAFLTTLAHESAFEYNSREHGDTRLYGGRGFIQLTGVDNYRAAGKHLGIDLVGNPDLAMSLAWSAKIARWYWTVNRHCNALADNLQIGKINAAIGYPVGDGTEDTRRCDSFELAMRILTGSIPAGISRTR
jgi:putative chitinase